MNPKETLRPYIEAHLDKKIPMNVIRHGLISHGWDSSVVDEVFSEIAGEPSPALKEELQLIARSYTKEDYNVIDALRDVGAALSTNPKVIGSMCIMGAIIIASAELATARINNAARETFSGSDDFINVVIIILIQLTSAFLVLGVSWGLVVALLWPAVNDAKDGKKSAVMDIVRLALPRASRIILATTLYAAVALLPIVVAVLAVQAAVLWLPLGLEVGLLLIILSSMYALYVALKYVLVPIIALFERDIKYTSLFSRASRLMSAGGMLFMLQILIPAIIVNVIVSVYGPGIDASGGSITALTVTRGISVTAISLVISCVWVMYYRNRKIVRE